MRTLWVTLLPWELLSPLPHSCLHHRFIPWVEKLPTTLLTQAFLSVLKRLPPSYWMLISSISHSQQDCNDSTWPVPNPRAPRDPVPLHYVSLPRPWSVDYKQPRCQHFSFRTFHAGSRLLQTLKAQIAYILAMFSNALIVNDLNKG